MTALAINSQVESCSEKTSPTNPMRYARTRSLAGTGSTATIQSNHRRKTHVVRLPPVNGLPLMGRRTPSRFRFRMMSAKT